METSTAPDRPAGLDTGLPADPLALLRMMRRIRSFEDSVRDLFARGVVRIGAGTDAGNASKLSERPPAVALSIRTMDTATSAARRHGPGLGCGGEALGGLRWSARVRSLCR